MRARLPSQLDDITISSFMLPEEMDAQCAASRDAEYNGQLCTNDLLSEGIPYSSLYRLCRAMPIAILPPSPSPAPTRSRAVFSFSAISRHTKATPLCPECGGATNYDGTAHTTPSPAPSEPTSAAYSPENAEQRVPTMPRPLSATATGSIMITFDGAVVIADYLPVPRSRGQPHQQQHHRDGGIPNAVSYRLMLAPGDFRRRGGTVTRL